VLDNVGPLCQALAEPGQAGCLGPDEREVTWVRRAFVVLSTAALFVVVWASAAVAQTDYPPTPTSPRQVVVPVQAPAALPRTGSSNTPSLVLIGIAALVVGLVLILAVRRRRAAVRGSI
ncbi:MAG TPA: LPXTG cell wall anchor domain-containing protein, partial [Acidimicrobiia bacterium]|nr:LPXTG cell wall anchor domain-containing protein [Acidimicrobiia bacterium]